MPHSGGDASQEFWEPQAHSRPPTLGHEPVGSSRAGDGAGLACAKPRDSSGIRDPRAQEAPLAVTRSSGPLWTRGARGRRPLRRQVPGLHAAAVGAQPAAQHAHGAGAGGRGPRQGEPGRGSRGCVVSWVATSPRVSPRSPQAPEGETQPMAEVDIFISTKRVKVLAADSQVPGGPGLGCRGHSGSPRGPQPTQRVSTGRPDGPRPADHLLHRGHRACAGRDGPETAGQEDHAPGPPTATLQDAVPRLPLGGCEQPRPRPDPAPC